MNTTSFVIALFLPFSCGWLARQALGLPLLQLSKATEAALLSHETQAQTQTKIVFKHGSRFSDAMFLQTIFAQFLQILVLNSAQVYSKACIIGSGAVGFS